MKKKYLIITTINKPNKILKRIDILCKKYNLNVIVIGDKKSPLNFNLRYSNYFNLKKQKNFNFGFAKNCPINSYSRKNIGYLLAMSKGADIIIDSDDDNIPKKNFFTNFNRHQICLKLSNKKWVNVYNYFLKSNKLIWPRGFPLDEINKKSIIKGIKKKTDIPIQQYLTEIDPDVDAIYRLILSKQNLKFKKKIPLAISSNSFTPFNSQNTRWFKVSFPLLYLPSYCSFRSSDILRSFIALRILQNCGMSLGYFSPSNFQIRNKHNLIKDFEDENILYLDTKKIVNSIYKTKIPKDKKFMLKALYIIYKKLIQIHVFPKKEMLLLKKWINDVMKMDSTFRFK